MPANLIDGLKKQQEPEPEPEMTIEEMRRQLKEMHSPSLDTVRTRIKTIPTSFLLQGFVFACMGTSGYDLSPEEQQLPEDEQQAILAALHLEIADEIDCRFPLPK